MKPSLVTSICFFVATIIWGMLFYSKIYEHNSVLAVIYGLAAICSLFVAMMHLIKYRKCK